MKMQQLILERLNQIETEKNIKILYACESGSRGWGFASPDSDYDIRFIYVRDINWYLSIHERKDFLDFSIDENDLDINGWDLRKLLGLLRKSNATPFEWLQSPIIYREVEDFRKDCMHFFPNYFNPKTLANHYLGIATGALKAGIIGDEFNIKKYFYVLRPVLAAKWVVDQKNVPPMEFQQLLEGINKQRILLEEIEQLVEQKLKAKEGALIKRNKIIDQFIKEEMDRCYSVLKTFEVAPSDSLPLDEFFRETVKRYNP